MKDALADLDAKVADAQRVISDGLLKIIEVLGLFIALVGFVAGTGVTAVHADSFGQMAGLTALFLVGSLGFFLLLRFTISFRPRRAHARRR